MPILGGYIHRKQITFDYLDTVTGQVRRGQVGPADREHLRGWLARFAGRDDVAFAVEGCTGWRYVAEELAAADVTVHLASRQTPRRPRPSGTPRPTRPTAASADAAGRGPCRNAGTARPHPGMPGAAELTTTWPRAHRLGQRIHAVFFHQGAPALGEGALPASRAWPRCGRPRPPICRRPGSCRSPPPWR